MRVSTFEAYIFVSKARRLAVRELTTTDCQMLVNTMGKAQAYKTNGRKLITTAGICVLRTLQTNCLGTLHNIVWTDFTQCY